MIITNINNLPAPLVKAVTPAPRERVPKRISITDLSNPPQMRALKILHESELTEDAGDRIFALMGTLLHGVLETEAQGLANLVAEEKLTMQVGDYTIVGKYDLSEMILDGERLTDYKLTSLFAVKEGVKPDWEAQLNCYAQLLREHGRNITELQIVAVLRDWSRLKAVFTSDYPPQQVKVMPVRVWSVEEIQKFMTERVDLHRQAEAGIYGPCTPAERWQKENKWALKKTGNKKATKLFNSAEEAQSHREVFNMVKGYDVEFRQGVSNRCAAFCGVSNVCPQWQAEKQQLAEREEKISD